MGKHIADLFVDSKYGDQFRTEGYITMPLLNCEEINTLQNVFEKFEKQAQIAEGFYTSIWSTNKEYRKETDEQIKKILLPQILSKLQAIQPVFSNFMVKGSGENSSLIAHQDWAFVEEPEFDSATIWIPLIDVDSANGNLQVVPGSHRLTNFVRGRFLDNVITQIDELRLKQILVDVPMKAGEAIVLNSRLIHASPPNFSEQKRVAVSLVVAPEVAPLYHWIVNDEGGQRMQRKISITPDFFWQYNYDDKLEAMSSKETEPYLSKTIQEFGLNGIKPTGKAKSIKAWMQALWQ